MTGHPILLSTPSRPLRPRHRRHTASRCASWCAQRLNLDAAQGQDVDGRGARLRSWRRHVEPADAGDGGRARRQGVPDIRRGSVAAAGGAPGVQRGPRGRGRSRRERRYRRTTALSLCGPGRAALQYGVLLCLALVLAARVCWRYRPAGPTAVNRSPATDDAAQNLAAPRLPRV